LRIGLGHGDGLRCWTPREDFVGGEIAWGVAEALSGNGRYVDAAAGVGVRSDVGLAQPQSDAIWRRHIEPVAERGTVIQGDALRLVWNAKGIGAWAIAGIDP
jgi:hypothetical protein